MLLRLEPRQETSKWMQYGSPLMAAVLTAVAGVILFSALGRDPFLALYTFFVRPLTSVYGLAEWAIKATPLLLCALGLSVGFRGNVWNIGAEGQLTMGAIAGGGVALAAYGDEGIWLLPLMIIAGGLGGMAWGCDPGLPEEPLQCQRDPDQPDADLRRDPVPRLSRPWAVDATRKGTTSRRPACFMTTWGMMPVLIEGTRFPRWV